MRCGGPHPRYRPHPGAGRVSPRVFSGAGKRSRFALAARWLRWSWYPLPAGAGRPSPRSLRRADWGAAWPRRRFLRAGADTAPSAGRPRGAAQGNSGCCSAADGPGHPGLEPGNGRYGIASWKTARTAELTLRNAEGWKKDSPEGAAGAPGSHPTPEKLATAEGPGPPPLGSLCFQPRPPPSPRFGSCSPVPAVAEVTPVQPARSSLSRAGFSCRAGSHQHIYYCLEEHTYIFLPPNSSDRLQKLYKNIVLPRKVLFFLPVALLIAQKKSFCHLNIFTHPILNDKR